MANRTKSLGHEMQRVIHIGLIDHWLRGLIQLTPRPTLTAQENGDDFNTHMLGFERFDVISDTDIQRMPGYRQLLARCNKDDIAIEINTKNNGYLSVEFKPEHKFKKSVIFGASYHNVLPTLFSPPLSKVSRANIQD